MNYPLFNGLVSMVSCLGHDNESCCRVIIVRAVGVQVPQIILQQEFILRQSLDWLQEIMGELQVATLGEVLEFLQKSNSKSERFQELLL